MAEVIIAESVSGVVIPSGDAPAVIVNEQQGAVIVANGERGANGSDGGYTDNEVAIDTQIVIGNSYRTNDTSLVTLTLPLDADSAEGDSFRILGVGLGGWKVAQNAGDVIIIAGGENSTTTGVTGFICSNYQYDCVECFKIRANTWLAIMTGGSFA